MTFLYPPDIFAQLEFDKVLQDLRRRCNGEPARIMLDDLPIYTDALVIREKLEEIICFQEILQDINRIHVGEYLDLRESLTYLRKQDSVLEIEVILEIRKQLEMVNAWFDFFSKDKRIRWKPLYQVLAQTEPLPKVRRLFYQIFDEEGNIKNTASDELAKIRKTFRQKVWHWITHLTGP
ncbi:MAG: hypothetical protein IPL46_05815 [Saprospiraceae bacterium]|nr:hypothetical protein [Saprospiraceae bacterium]